MKEYLTIKGMRKGDSNLLSVEKHEIKLLMYKLFLSNVFYTGYDFC